MADLAELQSKHADAARFVAGMAEEKDPQRLQQMAEQLQRRCVELGRMARALEAAATPERAAGGEARVVLTAEQRQRIAEQTGAGIETVTLQDSPERAWSRQWPPGKPRRRACGLRRARRWRRSSASWRSWTCPSSPRPSRSCGATRRSDSRGTDRRGACLA